jgi:hypothetical protein
MQSSCWTTENFERRIRRNDESTMRDVTREVVGDVGIATPNELLSTFGVDCGPPTLQSRVRLEALLTPGDNLSLPTISERCTRRNAARSLSLSAPGIHSQRRPRIARRR